MEKNQQLGLIGVGLLLIGAFAPVVSVPIIGSVNLTQGTDGYIIVGLAVVSGILILLNKVKWLWGTGLLSLGVIIVNFINIKSKLGEMAGRGGEFGEAMMKSISMQWGWILLVVGAILLIVAAARKSPTKIVPPAEQVSN